MRTVRTVSSLLIQDANLVVTREQELLVSVLVESGVRDIVVCG